MGVGKAGQEAWLRAQVQVDGEGPAAWIARALSRGGGDHGRHPTPATTLRVDLREEEATTGPALRGCSGCRGSSNHPARAAAWGGHRR